MKTNFIIVLLFSLILATPTWAARALRANESDEIRVALAEIESIWPGSQASRDLQAFYEQGRINAEDHWPNNLYGQTNFPIIGTQKITLNAHAIPNAQNRIYTGRWGVYALFDDRAHITSVLVHEWYHTTQSWAHNKFQPWNIEPPAWRKQKSFLQSMLERYGNDQNKRNRLETLIDTCDAEIKGNSSP